MKRAALAFTAVALLFSSPARADNAIEQAISNSIYENLRRRGENAIDKVDKTRKAIDRKLAQLVQDYNLETWLDVAEQLGIPKPFPMGQGNRDLSFCDVDQTEEECFYGGGGDFNGGGAGESYDPPPCEQVDYEIDHFGELVVPSMHLRNPMRVVYGDRVYTAAGLGPSHTNNILSTFKLFIWAQNANRSSATRWGVAKVEGAYITRSFPAYLDNGVWKRGQSGGAQTLAPTGSAWFATSIEYECPDGVALRHGAVFDGCARSPSDWNINPRAMIHRSELPGYMRVNKEMGRCPLHKDLLRYIIDEIYKAAAADPGYDGVPYSPVEPEDVKHGDEPPLVEETTDPPGSIPENSDPVNPGGDGPDDPDDPDDPEDEYENPNVPSPVVNPPSAQSLVDPAFSWFPDLPTIEINLGSPDCPVYTAEIFEKPLTLDVHCPLIEDNRALISALMIVVFTIASAAIVLRA